MKVRNEYAAALGTWESSKEEKDDPVRETGKRPSVLPTKKKDSTVSLTVWPTLRIQKGGEEKNTGYKNELGKGRTKMDT